MAVLYFIITVALLVIFSEELPHALALVFDGAFEGTAAAGGFAGAGIMLAMRSGIARGLFPMNPAWVPRQSWRQRQKRNGRLNRVLFP